MTARGAPVAVLVHGARHAAWCWDDAIAWLGARGHRTIAPTLRGHDADRGELDRVTLDDLAADVRARIEAIEAPVVLVGHSLGGAVAQKVALGLSRGALVLVSSVPPTGVLPEDDAHLAERVPDALARIEAFLVRRDPALFPRALFLSDRASAEAVDLVRARLGPASRRLGAELRIPIVDRPAPIPVHVIAGEDDAFLPPAAHERTRAFHRAPPVRTLPGGHDLMLDRAAPELFGLIEATLATLENP
jgi:pimeloyl-ACP methyl ester carboxylesterase